MLTIEPMFGLCNRMQALEAALALARALDRRLTVIWNLNPELNCRFEDLFVMPPGINSLQQPRRRGLKYYSGPSVRIGTTERPRTSSPQIAATGPLSTLALRGLRGVNRWLLADRRHDRAIYETEIIRMTEADFDFDTLRECPSVFIRAFTRFYVDRSLASHLRPTAAIDEQVRQQVALFSEPMVGVHIRRTDNRSSVGVSTTEHFVANMRDEVARQPLSRFFLSTDDPAEEAVLRRAFPGRILSRPKRTLDRNEPAAIQDALVDLYCLSHTGRVLGSFGSSFSRVAARLGGRELVVVGASDFNIPSSRP